MVGEWAVGHLNEMYVRDVNARQKNTKLEGNLNYDNDVYSFRFHSRWEILDSRDIFSLFVCLFS
jgi:hypothetical protein